MAGIYVHIPFCKQRCSYCDFHFSTSFSAYRKEMIDSICLEITSREIELKGEFVESIYFGGGTPSLLNQAELKQILNTITSQFQISTQAEITLEANPDDIQKEALRFWKSLGINRLSIGIQSFREKDLKWMNRAHTSQEAEHCVDSAKQEGFQAFSVDLIYGLPDLDLSTWKEHIEKVVSFGVDHISAYCLTIEEKTLLYKRVLDGKIIPSNEEEQAQQFELLRTVLKDLGYMQYEVSNFCKPGKEALHNSSYWKGEKYIGVGPSAHSFNGESRRFNVANNPRYIKLINANEPYFEEETLSEKDKFNELILTGLRTVWGVDLKVLNGIIPLPIDFTNRLSKFKEDNFVEESDGNIYLINDGWLMADYIASELFLG